MKMNLTIDERCEIEKVLDIYEGMVADKINQLCKTATYYSVVAQERRALDKAILELKDTQKQIQKIREKFETRRLYEDE